MPLVMRQLVDQCCTIFDRPILRRYRFAIDIGEAQAQRARHAFAFSDLAQNFEAALCGFPAAGINALIIAPAFVTIFGFDADGKFCLADFTLKLLKIVVESASHHFLLHLYADPLKETVQMNRST